MKKVRFTEDGIDASRPRRGMMGVRLTHRREPCQSPSALTLRNVCFSCT